jgi:hypothetical protein
VQANFASVSQLFCHAKSFMKNVCSLPSVLLALCWRCSAEGCRGQAIFLLTPVYLFADVVKPCHTCPVTWPCTCRQCETNALTSALQLQADRCHQASRPAYNVALIGMARSVLQHLSHPFLWNVLMDAPVVNPVLNLLRSALFLCSN